MSITNLRERYGYLGTFSSGYARKGVLAALVSLFVASTSGAQGPIPLSAVSQTATRSALLSRATQLESELASGKGKKSAGASTARVELQAIRDRLANGDFHVGDRFTITVRQDTVRADTASVRDSLKVAVLNLPDLSLHGVLRSELDETMARHVGRFVRNATVRTSVLTRISILGAVKAPGFYYVSPDRPVSDLVMVAGGPGLEAKPNTMELYRAGKRLVESSRGEQFVKGGLTLAQIDVRSGDEIRIPVKRKINWQMVMQLFLIASSLLFALLGFVQWYYNRQDG